MHPDPALLSFDSVSKLPARNRRTRTIASRRLNAGVTLVEVSISVLVSAVGLLGVAALYMTSLRSSYEAMSRVEASTLINDMVDRMHSNRSATLSGAYQIDYGAAAAATENANRAERDLKDWKLSLRSQLPEGDGSVVTHQSADGVVVSIKVRWTPAKATVPLEQISIVEM